VIKAAIIDIVIGLNLPDKDFIAAAAYDPWRAIRTYEERWSAIAIGPGCCAHQTGRLPSHWGWPVWSIWRWF
jgi:hypothetical protein